MEASGTALPCPGPVCNLSFYGGQSCPQGSGGAVRRFRPDTKSGEGGGGGGGGLLNRGGGGTLYERPFPPPPPPPPPPPVSASGLMAILYSSSVEGKAVPVPLGLSVDCLKLSVCWCVMCVCE